jgi:biotin operon repressor
LKCYLLSKPRGWQANATELRRALGWTKPALSAAMKKIEKTGCARLYRRHGCWHWQVRESEEVDWPLDGSVGKIEHYGQGQFFTPIANDTLLDKSLGGTALKIICDPLSRPVTWQLCLWELQQRLGLSNHAIRKAMPQLVNGGYALRIPSLSGGSCYRIRETPKLHFSQRLVENPTQRKTDPVKIRPISNKRLSTNERVPKNKQKGGKGVGKHASTALPFRCRFPYPASEKAMYETLEQLGIETYPDHDGNFFEDMNARGWVLPNGKRVYDWVATYQARCGVTVGGGELE